MDQLSAMRAYRSIIESGSFTQAAERLGTTHTSVSRQLGQLETQLGVRLLNRNSRHLTATEAGAQYYRDCVDILDRIDAARQRLNVDPELPSGVLRLSLPHAIGALELGQWLPGFMQRHPKIDLDLSCDDRMVDLVKGGFDMAIRISGPLADSSLVARELAVSERVLVATPQYVAHRGLPRSIDDLQQHSLLAYAADGPALQLTSNSGEEAEVKFGTRLRLDSILALHAAVMAGQGIAAFTFLTVRDDLAAGRLLRVLPQHHAGQRRYFALYPHARQLTPKVRAFTEYMRAHYAMVRQGLVGKSA
ncbi:LysR family transcriptional regulator [Lysobacter antibioticus]|uniref:Bacterial regulatory helix-turn-helix, lysR family protein n=1 Tax=Lysobacter antibioticus TaxID=84531 RepID=A0A0S2FA32_LYSAN|nr:LysR family transcriptional regulator [Lysobacter antibioticus]ALN80410.1 bacterial regulatory helix-turn-helix, lysR family protein [Lysobacter antibioticus]